MVADDVRMDGVEAGPLSILISIAQPGGGVEYNLRGLMPEGPRSGVNQRPGSCTWMFKPPAHLAHAPLCMTSPVNNKVERHQEEERGEWSR